MKRSGSKRLKSIELCVSFCLKNDYFSLVIGNFISTELGNRYLYQNFYPITDQKELVRTKTKRIFMAV